MTYALAFVMFLETLVMYARNAVPESTIGSFPTKLASVKKKM